LKEKDDIYEVIKAVDYIKLWYMLNEIAVDWDNDSFEIDQKIMAKEAAYGIFHGMHDLFTGDYVVCSWLDNPDPVDLQSDIVTLNSNLATLGALILTIAIPMSLAVNNSMYITANPAMYAYVFMTYTCGFLEGISVLICIRNLVLVSLANPENISEFVKLSTGGLMMPTRLNFLAVLSMAGSLISYSMWQYDAQATIIFSLILIFPLISILLYYLGIGVRDLHAIQGYSAKQKNGNKKNGEEIGGGRHSLKPFIKSHKFNVVDQ
jgi:hypothetical protein